MLKMKIRLNIRVTKAYNRVDSCSDKLASYWFKIKKGGVVKWTTPLKIKVEDVTIFIIPGYIVGDKVMIQLKGTNIDSLAEIEPFAKQNIAEEDI